MSDTFDDMCRELSTDLAEAVEAQTEPVLHPKRPGRGIEAIREHISRQFEHIHDDLARSLRETVLRDTDKTATPRRQAKPHKPQVTLDQAARIFSRHVVHVSCRHHFHGACYEIGVPTESYAELIAAAVKVVSDLPDNEDRYTIVEE